MPASQHQSPKSDIEISQTAQKRRILDIAKEKLGIAAENLEPYGHYKAKVSMDYVKSLKDKKNGKMILVTAITPTPAGGTALHTEGGPERRLAQAQHRLFADVVERVGEADRGGGLAFAGRRRGDRGHQDQLAVLLVFERFHVIHRHLGLVMTIGLEVFRRDAELFLGKLDDRPLLGVLRNFDVGFR